MYITMHHDTVKDKHIHLHYWGEPEQKLLHSIGQIRKICKERHL